MEETKAFLLDASGKNSWFYFHRQILPNDHDFRRSRQHFRKGNQEWDDQPYMLTEKDVWYFVRDFPKETKHEPAKILGFGTLHNWTNRSIFLGYSVLER
jgi:hypothetical protein